MSSWQALLLSLVGIAAIFALLRTWQRSRLAPSAELTRKAAHVATGLVAAGFPWLFTELWPGLLVCGLSLTGMISMRVFTELREGMGRVTGSIDRASWGDLCFPISVAIVWWLSDRQPKLYVAPVLLLTFGDAAAALIGNALGHHTYRTTEGRKSLEGSLAFLITGMASTLACLTLLAPALDLSRAALIAILLGSLLMVFEAISWRGLDNLILPILAFVLLRFYLQLDAAQLAIRLAAFAGCILLMLLVKPHAALIGEGALAAAIFLYGAWALGDWDWFAPPAAAVLAIPWVPRYPGVPRVSIHGVFPVLALSGAGLVLLIMHVVDDRDPWTPYVATFSSAMAIIALAQLHPHVLRPPRALRTLGALALGVAIVAVPAAVIRPGTMEALPRLILVSSMAGALGLTIAFMPALNRLAGDRWLWLLRGCANATSAALAVILDTVFRSTT